LWVLTDPDLVPCALAITERKVDDSTEILLAGVIPEARRRGIYSELLQGIMGEEARSGISLIRISTQSGNIGVMRAWAKLGFLPYMALNTLHVTKFED
jgi:ribosomal protein S18 acetylase RimI-like enzyme